ncbi:MAG: hypothetical protein LBC20_12635 [Planctomycetaceae bacterium]|jgi:hypothetical protein|nr:hypothetical protein [Planctomycetaceae bacterium]
MSILLILESSPFFKVKPLGILKKRKAVIFITPENKKTDKILTIYTEWDCLLLILCQVGIETTFLIISEF